MRVRSLIFMMLASFCLPAMAAGPNSAQKTGAEAFLAALAGGNVMAVAQELHPDEVEKLRSRLLVLFRAEASRRSEEHTSELQSRRDLVCRLLLEKKKNRR